MASSLVLNAVAVTKLHLIKLEGLSMVDGRSSMPSKIVFCVPSYDTFGKRFQKTIYF